MRCVVSATKIRVIFDTHIFLRAAINRKSLPAKLFFDWRHQYQLITSEEMSNEVLDVLTRPKVRAKFSALTDEIVREILEQISSAEQITLTEIPAMARDPKDDMFLACAVVGKADYIVSEDRDLLVLDPFGNTRIVDVTTFWEVLQSLNNE